MYELGQYKRKSCCSKNYSNPMQVLCWCWCSCNALTFDSLEHLCIYITSVFVSVLGNICEANICFLKQQPDPNHEFHIRWVLPYEKETLCSCTEIRLHHESNCTRSYHISLPEAKNYFYTDNPLLFVNSDSHDSLQILLKCKEGKNWFYF